MKKNRNRKENQSQGFTLLEVLVALTICAVTAVMLYHQVNGSVISSERLEEKTIALLVAKNYYNDLLVNQAVLSPGENTEQVSFSHREWFIRSTTKTLDYAQLPFESKEKLKDHLYVVDVVIFNDKDNEYPVVSLSRLIGER